MTDQKRKPYPIKRPTVRGFTCEVGDIVIYHRSPYEIAQVIQEGREEQIVKGIKNYGRQSLVSGYRIMENGQVLRRTPVFLGASWKHKK